MFISPIILVAWFSFGHLACGSLGSEADPLSVSQMKRDSAIEEILGPETSTLISKANRIRLYRLKPFTTESSAREKRKRYFENYEVLGRKGLDSKKVSQMKGALLDPASYVRDDVNKCTFAATMGAEISYKKERVVVITSYPCNKLLFIRGGKESYREVKSLESFDLVARRLFKDLPEVH